MGEGASTPDLVIRAVRAEDLSTVCEIEESSFKRPYPRSLIKTLAYLRSKTFLVAEESGKIVGYVVTTLQSRDLGHVLSMAVHPNHRRRGIGSALMHRTTEALRKMGATSVRLEVRKSNVAAQRFYEKLGFKYVYTIEDYYENDDALVFFTTL